jgi:UDP-N-acetylmuramate dehydrogenase
VVYRLSKKKNFTLNYGHLKESLEEFGEINIKNIRSVIVSVRNSKLPDPAVTGNAGSFFKNPEISQHHYDKLTTKYHDIPGFFQESGLIKVPAGWMIEQCGWKGKRAGNVAVHDKQALVLVNDGNATGQEILKLARNIMTSVSETFSVELEMEVNVI